MDEKVESEVVKKIKKTSKKEKEIGLSDIPGIGPGAVCGAPESFYISGCNRYCRDVRGFISGTAVEYGCGVSPATVACLCVR
jgi:hypothetical protein